MKIDEALERLDAMAALTSRLTTYDGLRATPLAATAGVGLAAGVLQTVLLPVSVGDPSQQAAGGFVLLWTCAAAIAMSLVVLDMFARYLSDPTARARRMTVDVLQRLAPALTVGAGVTLVILLQAPEVCWMLPGLWAVLLGLGIWSACVLLPKPLHHVAMWYFTCGFTLLLLGQNDFSLHPLAMVVPFGGGQLLAAALLQRLEAVQPDSSEA